MASLQGTILIKLMYLGWYFVWIHIDIISVVIWMCGATKMDRIRNGSIRMKVGEISKKVQERRHVMRKDEHYVGKRMRSMDVAGKRRKGRPKRRWMDNVNVDLREERKKLYLTPNRQMYNASKSHIRYKIRAIYTHAYAWTHVNKHSS